MLSPLLFFSLTLLTLLTPLTSGFYCETYKFSKQLDLTLHPCNTTTNNTNCAYFYNNKGVFSGTQITKAINLAKSYKAIVMYSDRDVCCSSSRVNYGLEVGKPVYILKHRDFNELLGYTQLINFNCSNTISEYHPSSAQLTIIRGLIIATTVIFISLSLYKLTLNTRINNMSIWVLLSTISILFRNTIMFIDPFFTTGLIPSTITVIWLFNIPTITIIQTMWIVLYYEELTRVKMMDFMWIKENRCLFITTGVVFLLAHLGMSVFYVNFVDRVDWLIIIPVFLTFFDVAFTIGFCVVVLVRTLNLIKTKKARMVTSIIFMSLIVLWIAVLYCIGLQNLIRNNTPALYMVKIGVLVLVPSGCEAIIQYSDNFVDRFITISSTTKGRSSKGGMSRIG